MKDAIEIEADNNIYSIGRSLRIPNCVKFFAKQKASTFQMLKPAKGSSLVDCLFTIPSKTMEAVKLSGCDYWIN